MGLSGSRGRSSRQFCQVSPRYLQHTAQPAASLQHLAHVAASLQQPPSHFMAEWELSVLQPVVSNIPATATMASIIMVFIFVGSSVWMCVDHNTDVRPRQIFQLSFCPI
jgi:hypothetical protein